VREGFVPTGFAGISERSKVRWERRLHEHDKQSVPASVRMKVADYDGLYRLAKAHRVSIPAVVRASLQQTLARHDDPKS